MKITINDILDSSFLSKYYEKFSWLSGFLTEYKHIIFQVIAIALFASFVLAFFIIIKLLKKLYPRKILAISKISSNKTFIAIEKKTRKARDFFGIFYKEVVFLLTITPMSLFLKMLGLENGVLVFLTNFIIASLIGKVVQILSKSLVSYKSAFIIVLMFTLMDKSIFPFLSSDVGKINVFYSFSIADLFCFFASLIASFFIFKSVKLITKTKVENSKIDSSIKIVARYSIDSSCLLVLIFFVLRSTNIDLKALTVFAGAIGVGIGLGMQKIAARISNGVIIILDQNMKKGDWVEIGGVHGIVKSVTTRHVKLISFDGQQVYIPSETAVSQVMTNYTMRNYGRISEIVNIKNAKDVDLAISIILKAARKNEYLFEDNEKYMSTHCYVSSVSPKGIELKLSMWIVNYAENVNFVKSSVLLDVLHEFETNKIDLFHQKI